MKNLSLSHIVLIDDDVEEKDIFEFALQDLGIAFEFHYFSDPKNFLLFYNESIIPKIAFIDLHMPHYENLDMLLEIKKDLRFQDMEIILYTSGITPAEKTTIAALGFYDVIIKPNDFGEMKSILTKVIDTKAFPLL